MRNILILIAALFLSLQSVNAVETVINGPHGFGFGISKKDALEIIETNSKSILENEKDSKDIRRIIFDGSIVSLPINNSNHQETRLEFFKKKLMSSSLYYKFDNDVELSKAKEQYLEIVKSQFGEASQSEKMLSYELWSWEIPDIKILLNSNLRNKSLKIEYLYQPVVNKKIAKELNDKRKDGPAPDPAKEMFLDGTYTRPKY
ncbi:MAG: hypothetical protein GTO02_01210 [Candidatus Dadabacteria bacterium]|nr:hypothetical protein [Candidatus Dadabacteria bacterium]NIQ13059.1 hypothetical protein [Candidatus Dadabacteria bacterium]